MKILIGEIHQESNTFSPLLTSLEENGKQSGVYLGQDLARSSSPQIRAAMEIAAAEGMQCVPVIGFVLQNAGPFAADEFEKLKGLLVEQTRKALQESGPVDGVYLSLHGAMVAESCDDTETELIRLIRREVGGQVPVTVSLDPHAHMTRALVASVDGMVAYKTYPHTDMKEAAGSAVRLLISMMRGESKPHLAFRKIPMIVPAENSRSSQGPFREILDEAEAGVCAGDALMTSVFPSQPWLDVEELGFSVVVTGHDPERAEREADRLAGFIWNKRHDFSVELKTVAEVVDLALGRPKGTGPVVASFSADSPGAGSSSDGNFVLKQLMELNAQEKLICLLNIVDAPAVEAAIGAGIGNELEVPVGHSLNRVYGTPLRVKGRVSHLFSGLVPERASGAMVAIGKAAVLEIGKISLLIHELPVCCIAPSLFRAVGLDPAASDITVVRSAAQFRDEYEPIASAVCILQAPGFSTPDLKSLVFKKIKRPFFPFDDDFIDRFSP
jgi:microcystin degradation protein MlrC